MATIGSCSTTGSVYGFVLSNGLAYLASGSTGLQIVNISDPANLVWVGGIDTPGFASRSVALAGNLAFVAADGTGGLRIYDVADPSHIVPLGHEYHPDAHSVQVVEDKIYVTAAG